MPNWFALRVRPKHEKTAATNLSRLGFDEYVPLHQGPPLVVGSH